MANGGKLLSVMVATALWLPAIEGAIAAGRLEIDTPTPSLLGELWLSPDFGPHLAAPPRGIETVAPLRFLNSPAAQTLAQTLAQTPSPIAEANRLFDLGRDQQRQQQLLEALFSWQQALEIYQELNDYHRQAVVLGNIGNIYQDISQYENAIASYEQSAHIFEQISDARGWAGTQLNLAVVLSNQGRYSEAVDRYQESLESFRSLGESRGEAYALDGLGIVNFNLGRYQQAGNYHRMALSITSNLEDALGKARALGNLGRLYIHLGSYSRAVEVYEQVLQISQSIQNRQLEAFSLGNLAISYRNLNQLDIATGLLFDSLLIQDQINDLAGQARTSGSLGNIYYARAHYAAAIDFYQLSLETLESIGERFSQGVVASNLGMAYLRSSQYSAAATTLEQALAIQQDIGDRAGEGTTLSNIGILLSDRNQPELAITFLKASVDVREAIRGDIRDLDPSLQQSFTDAVAGSYRLLADLLLQADRVLEAQEVLDLLKLQELEDYQLRNVRGTEETREGLSFWPPEREILALFYEQLGSEQDLNRFINRPEVADRIALLQRNARSQNPNPDQLARLQGNLQQAGNAALLYPLVLDDRLELILVTTTGISRHTVPVDRRELNRVIAAFRSDLVDRFSNPLPHAQQLYQWLIAPLAAEIDAVGAKTLLYAADGPLRYIPLAAIHDGEQWLTQRYTVNHITAASLMDFSDRAAAPLSILAGAFPAQDLVIEVAGESQRFNGLPYAQVEVRNLQASLPGTQAFFSGGFNRRAIEPRLGNHSVIHLATHGQFRSGHPNDSFILLGDGDRITLFDLDQWQLPNAALVVLSACETAVSGPELGSGEEILGFGYQMQRTGARAAIASLWVVSDGGTQILMDAFYDALQTGQGASAAIRQAQAALIEGDLTASEVERSATVDVISSRTGLPLAVAGNLAHPYYWAPFILIGNGL